MGERAGGGKHLSETVTMDIDNDLAVIVIDNPPVNALSGSVIDGMNLALTVLEENPDIRLAVLLCAGRGFIAGADLKEAADSGRNRSHEAAMMINRLARSSKPVLVAIHGNALGGGFETTLACDYRIALASARFGLPEVNIGAMPGYGGTQRLPRLIGVEKALDMMLTGQPVTAGEALQLGIADRIVEGDLRQAAITYGRALLAEGVPLRKVDARPVQDIDQLTAITEKAAAHIALAKPGQDAPPLIVQTLRDTLVLPIEQGLAIERERSSGRLKAPQCLAMRHLFFVRVKARKNPAVAALLESAGGKSRQDILAATLNGNPAFSLGAELLWAFVRQAQAVAGEGVPSESIDSALEDFGWARGPFGMLEDAGLAGDWREGVTPEAARPDAIVDRCMAALIDSANELLERSSDLSAGDIDAVLCDLYGFPVYRGGPMYWAALEGKS